MSLFREGYTIKDQFATHFLTFTICAWIDLFKRKIYKDIVIDAFRYAQEKDQLILNAFVIMSNHIHLIGRANEKQEKTLSDIIRDFKKFTHRQMIDVVQSNQESRRDWMIHQFNYYGSRKEGQEGRQIWTNDNHPEECFSHAFIQSKLNYTHQNPVRAGIVKYAEDYIYSSASNYAGKGGILKIELI